MNTSYTKPHEGEEWSAIIPWFGPLLLDAYLPGIKSDLVFHPEQRAEQTDWNRVINGLLDLGYEFKIETIHKPSGTRKERWLRKEHATPG